MSYQITTGPTGTGTVGSQGGSGGGGGGGTAPPGNASYANAQGWGVATNSLQRFFIDNNGDVQFNSNTVALAGDLAVAGASSLSGPITLGNGATIINDAVDNPNGVVTAVPGSLLLNSNGGFNKTAWLKEMFLDATGWTALGKSTVYAECDPSLTVGTCVYLVLAAGIYTAHRVTVDTLDIKPAVGVVLATYGHTCQVAVSGFAQSVVEALVPQQPVYVGANGQPTSDPSNLPKPFFQQPIGISVDSQYFAVSASAPTYFSGAP